jgi:hypothetical protein
MKINVLFVNEPLMHTRHCKFIDTIYCIVSLMTIMFVVDGMHHNSHADH